jgi:dihydroxyacetone kinase phosphotransfer subunit
MVGIVLVSHSALLARGLQEITIEMSHSQVKIVAAGGIDDQTMGTNAERIRQAIASAYSLDGVLILFDLGSALLSTEVALESLTPEMRENIIISDAPMVEGAVVAAVEASLGRSLARVNAAAEAARDMPKLPN